ncbi:MAG: hypothetical protein IIY22_08075 [Erysipelotrichaceae bacterium]|nr:hypothetical protein [Erysipelotrichaceae bacterium]
MLTLLITLGLISLGFHLLFAVIGLALRIAFHLSPFFLIYYLLTSGRRAGRYYW